MGRSSRKKRRKGAGWRGSFTLARLAVQQQEEQSDQHVQCAWCGTKLADEYGPDFVILGARVETLYLHEKHDGVAERAAQKTKGAVVMFACCLGCLPHEGSA